MAWDFAAIRDDIKARLETITGMSAGRVHDTVPSNPTPPCLIIAPADPFIVYRSSTNSTDLAFDLTLLVSKAWDRTAQDQLDSFLTDSGPKSIFAAIEGGGGDLDGAVDYATVTDARNYGLITYAGVQYLGCEFAITVAVS